MPEKIKLLDELQWGRTSVYLDLIVFLILLVGIWIIAFSSYLRGYWTYPISVGEVTPETVNQLWGAIAGIIAGIAVVIVSFVWIFYRYFKKGIKR